MEPRVLYGTIPTHNLASLSHLKGWPHACCPPGHPWTVCIMLHYGVSAPLRCRCKHTHSPGRIGRKEVCTQEKEKPDEEGGNGGRRAGAPSYRTKSTRTAAEFRGGGGGGCTALQGCLALRTAHPNAVMAAGSALVSEHSTEKGRAAAGLAGRVRRTRVERRPRAVGTFEPGVAVQEGVGRDHARPPRVTGHLGPHQIADTVLEQLVYVSASTRAGLSLGWNLKVTAIKAIRMHPTPTPEPCLPPAEGQGSKHTLAPKRARPSLLSGNSPDTTIQTTRSLALANSAQCLHTAGAQAHTDLRLNLFPCRVGGLQACFFTWSKKNPQETRNPYSGPRGPQPRVCQFSEARGARTRGRPGSTASPPLTSHVLGLSEPPFPHRGAQVGQEAGDPTG